MEVDGEEVVDLFVGGRLERGGLVEGGVVDKGVEAGELLAEDCGDGVGGALGVGEISLDGEGLAAEFSDELFELVGFALAAAIGEGDVEAGGGEL